MKGYIDFSQTQLVWFGSDALAHWSRGADGLDAGVVGGVNVREDFLRGGSTPCICARTTYSIFEKLLDLDPASFHKMTVYLLEKMRFIFGSTDITEFLTSLYRMIESIYPDLSLEDKMWYCCDIG